MERIFRIFRQLCSIFVLLKTFKFNSLNVTADIITLTYISQLHELFFLMVYVRTTPPVIHLWSYLMNSTTEDFWTWVNICTLQTDFKLKKTSHILDQCKKKFFRTSSVWYSVSATDRADSCSCFWNPTILSEVNHPWYMKLSSPLKTSSMWHKL